MKIVCMSDTHGINMPNEIPDGDMLIHAGDLSLTGQAHEIEHALAWLRKFPHKYKIVIGGNHDNALCELPYLFDEWLRREWKGNAPITLLRGSMVEIEGYKIFGSSVIPHNDEFRAGARAYMLDGTTARHWGLAPSCDILVTHGPPKHCRDGGCGDPALATYVQWVKPKLHVFGHVHHARGVTDFKDTKYVNAAMVNAAYEPVHDPIVVEV